MLLGRDVDGPMFRYDKDKLIEDGQIVQVDMPEFGSLGSPELYRVTPKGGANAAGLGLPLGRYR